MSWWFLGFLFFSFGRLFYFSWFVVIVMIWGVILVNLNEGDFFMYVGEIIVYFLFLGDNLYVDLGLEN